MGVAGDERLAARGRGSVSLDFAMHDGIAANWARGAQPGDTVEATVQGSAFDFPKPLPRRV